MQYLQLGGSDLKVSRICFGGEQLGGFEWGNYDVKETLRTAHEAIEHGINFYDTADCYGPYESELRLGEVIAEQRDRYIVSTKFGVRLNTDGVKRSSYDNTKDYMTGAVEGSLKRLGTDYIDLYQVHYWDQITPYEEIFSNLEALCKQGKIRYYGISNFIVPETLCQEFPHLVSFSSEYSLANRSSVTDAKVLTGAGLTYMAYGSLAQGLLTGKYDENTVFDPSDRRRHKRYKQFHGETLRKNLSIVKDLRGIQRQLGESVTIAQLAQRWVLENLKNSVVITGLKSSRQLMDAAGVFDFKINKEVFDLL